MRIINTHRRIINQSQDTISELLSTLSTNEDKIWPYEQWPAIRFRDGLNVGSKGGHGLVRYTIIEYIIGKSIKFEFTSPKGFNGTHQFVIQPIDAKNVEIAHVIDMQTSGFATPFWIIAIRWLHDALIEDAFDKVESQFTTLKKKSTPTHWVRFLRYVIKLKKNAIQ